MTIGRQGAANTFILASILNEMCRFKQESWPHYNEKLPGKCNLVEHDEVTVFKKHSYSDETDISTTLMLFFTRKGACLRV